MSPSYNIRIDEPTKEKFDKAHFDFQAKKGRTTQSEYVQHLVDLYNNRDKGAKIVFPNPFRRRGKSSTNSQIEGSILNMGDKPTYVEMDLPVIQGKGTGNPVEAERLRVYQTVEDKIGGKYIPDNSFKLAPGELHYLLIRIDVGPYREDENVEMIMKFKCSDGEGNFKRDTKIVQLSNIK